MIKKLFIHKTNITINRIWFHRVIFIQIKRNYIFKTQTFFFVQTNQFSIQSFW